MSNPSPSDPGEAPVRRTRSEPCLLDLAPGHHLCAFYRGHAGLGALVLPFLREGLSQGEHCAAIMDSLPPAWVVSLFDREDAKLRRRLPEELQLLSSAVACKDGDRFSAERLLGHLDARPTRLAAELTWALRAAAGSSELRDYEAELRRVRSAAPVALLCLYDLDALDGSTVVEVLNTHRKVLVEGYLVENPFASVGSR